MIGAGIDRKARVQGEFRALDELDLSGHEALDANFRAREVAQYTDVASRLRGCRPHEVETPRVIGPRAMREVDADHVHAGADHVGQHLLVVRCRTQRRDDLGPTQDETHAARLSRTSTAGSFLPSTNSRNAPPPVEIYEMLSSMPYFSMAARVSPPPARENALLRAMALASVRVPSPNCSNSNTPTGPFHSTVPADATSLAISSAESGPTSRIISLGRTLSTGFTSASALAENSVATTTSVGMGITMPRFFAWVSRRLQISSMSGSCSDLPTLYPSAARNVFVMPPPTMSWSTFANSVSSTVSLVDTLDPATIASKGRSGFSSAVSSADNSLARSGPAQATGAYLATA